MSELAAATALLSTAAHAAAHSPPARAPISTRYRSFAPRTASVESPGAEPAPAVREWVRLSQKPIFDGANGIIFKALDAQGNLFVVIKTVKMQPWHSASSYRQSVLREYDNLARCQASRHVATVYDVCTGEAGNELSLVVQYYPHGDLLDFLGTLRKKRVAMPTPLKDAVFKQIVRAVDFLHRHDIVHRDIKPENFLIDALGVLRLNDFGCSVDLRRQREQLPLNGLGCGTPSFKAPELFGLAVDPLAPAAELAAESMPELAAESMPDFKSVDVWALGIVCFHVYLMAAPWPTADVADDRSHAVALYLKHFPSTETLVRSLADRLNDKNCSTLLNPALLLFKKIHYHARIELLAMLHPTPAKRPSTETLLQLSWLSQAFAKPAELLALAR